MNYEQPLYPRSLNLYWTYTICDTVQRYRQAGIASMKWLRKEVTDFFRGSLPLRKELFIWDLQIFSQSMISTWASRPHSRPRKAVLAFALATTFQKNTGKASIPTSAPSQVTTSTDGPQEWARSYVLWSVEGDGSCPTVASRMEPWAPTAFLEHVYSWITSYFPEQLEAQDRTD